MKLRVVGSSPAWPNPGGAQSGYLVECEEGRVLLDCGPGVLPRLREREGWPDLDAIVITHFHLDHWGDLVPWVWGTIVGPGRDARRVDLWLPPNGSDRLADFGARLGWADMFEQVFTLREFADGEPFEAGGLQVTPVRVPHYTLQAYGLRVANSSVTLAYSGDSGPSERLAELARDVDLFVCEATLDRGELDGTPRGHLSAEEAIDAFEASGARRLLITHRPHELTLNGHELAHDGLEVVLEPAP